MIRKQLTEIISALFIFLFVYAAMSQFLEFGSFRAVLHKSPLAGDNAPIVAWASPLLEFGISLLLLVPRTRRQGLWSSFVLMLLLAGYLSWLLLTGRNWPGLYGGWIGSLELTQHLYLIIFFMVLAVTGLRWDRQRHPTPYPGIIYRAMC